jgi:hypothetical protein
LGSHLVAGSGGCQLQHEEARWRQRISRALGEERGTPPKPSPTRSARSGLLRTGTVAVGTRRDLLAEGIELRETLPAGIWGGAPHFDGAVSDGGGVLVDDRQPARCVEALRRQRAQQLADRLRAGDRWQENGLVFATSVGTKMSAGNVRRDFRRALALVPGIDPSMWTPRELRHSFVSLLSDAGVPLEEISQLVGHSGTTVTELVYRHQLKPVIQTGATVMDRLLGA